MADWFNIKADDAFETSKKIQPSTSNSNRKGPFRFSLKRTEKKDIMFLDGFDTMACWWERNFYHNGNFWNYTPHLGKNRMVYDPVKQEVILFNGQDPLDKAFPYEKLKPGQTKKPGSKVYLTGMLTVADLTGVSTDEGVKYIGSRFLYPMKYGHAYKTKENGKEVEKKTTGSADILKGKLENLRRKGIKDLTGTVWSVSRRDDKSPRNGDEFDFIDYIPPQDWGKYAAQVGYTGYETYPWKPYKYSDIIVPMSLLEAEELAKEILAERNGTPYEPPPTQEAEVDVSYENDDEIPF